MSFIGILTPEQLTTLRQAFDAHCRAIGILTAEDREAAAIQLMTAIRIGSKSFEEIAADLASANLSGSDGAGAPERHR